MRPCAAGPSGAGKSTFLDALADRLAGRGRTIRTTTRFRAQLIAQLKGATEGNTRLFIGGEQ